MAHVTLIKSRMSRKHFVALAAEQKADKPTNPQHVPAWEDRCRDLAGTLAGTNPRFDRSRFLAACGVYE